MSKIALVLPGNTFHANQLDETIPPMDSERYGLPTFRKWGIPALVFFQGLDVAMKPWLRAEMQTPGSIEWGNAPFSHTLMPLFPGSWRDEMRTPCGSVPVTFFGEFYVPRGEVIPTEFTLVLAGNSVLYSSICDFWSVRQGDILVQPYPAETHAIKFDGRVGILLREEWFAPFLKAVFLFQRYPTAGTHPEGRNCLAELVAEVRTIADAPDERVVVAPLDLEAPWIGGRCGGEVWEIFFSALHREELTHVFTPLSSHLGRFAAEAIPTSRPRRELRKWANWEVQLLHTQKLNARQAESPHEATLRMIATGSDIFAAWGIKIMESNRRMMLSGVGRDGSCVEIPISYNQAVIDIQLAAWRALEYKTKLHAELERLEKGGSLIALATNMARQHNW